VKGRYSRKNNKRIGGLTQNDHLSSVNKKGEWEVTGVPCQIPYRLWLSQDQAPRERLLVGKDKEADHTMFQVSTNPQPKDRRF
jgi:hypothetical protein